MIFDNKILTEEEAMDVSNRVLSMRLAFIDRGTFDTLGASVYLDDPLSYIGLKDETNPLLKHNFDDLYKKVIEEITSMLHVPVKHHPYGALPGFHIFGKDSAGHQGHKHIDQPYQRLFWPEPFHMPFSFTLALNVPDKAGLEVWPNLVTEEPEYVDYTAGHMYSHVGHVTHRIAGVGNPTDENPRITLQGHGAILSLSQEAVIYF
tara:strand:- start:487 stop:1101 length:615 start_codon:yes stop_codon:yes gene_type:complete